MGETDLISRQAAIAAADRADYTGFVVEDVKTVTDEVVKELKQLPSVQPEKVYVAEVKVDGEELQRCIDRAVEQIKKEEQPKTPCDLCRHNPPSSGDGKPCSYCPAEGEWE